MNVILFGATGMVGQGALRECLRDTRVDRVLTVGRAATGVQHPKVRELVHPDLVQYASIETDLAGFDACLFCLGVSSAGMTEDAYSRVTYGIAMAAAQTLVRLNPAMMFVFVSGAGADSSERGRSTWARIKGKTENALLRLPFKAVYVVRPAYIQPMHGERSRTPAYRLIYALGRPLVPLLRRLWPGAFTTTERLGRAMIAVAAGEAPSDMSSHILTVRDINAIA
jgi:uncharacterized protein YbjT (DUF2867 family)